MHPKRLVSWVVVFSGLGFSVTAGAAPRTVLFPGVARAAGANSTAWRSDATLHNPTASPQTVRLELLPRGSATPAASTTLTVGVGATRQIASIYDQLGATDGAGMLRVTGDVIAWVRTYNQGARGTFGQDLAPVEPDGGYAPGEVVAFPFSTPADIRTGFRSNVLLVNLDAVPITATLAIAPATRTVDVPAGAYVQVDNLGAFLGAQPGVNTARVTATGRWSAVVSTIDPATGDPTTVRGLGPGETGERLFVGVARAAGANQTQWRSEAVLHNPTEQTVEATLELIPRGSDTVAASTTLTLLAGRTRRVEDVYDTLGVASGAGTLRVSGDVLAWVRTFNQGSSGTFGQDLPPVHPWVAVGPSIPVALPFRAAADIQTGFRSNLVVQNLEDRELRLSIRSGRTEKTRTVPAGAYIQIDNLGAFLAVPPGAATAWIQADGRWAGAVSTIDPITGDPTTLRDDRTFQPATSSDLIDAAVARQELDAEQGLVYKVYADFDDPQLPPQYRGDDRNVPEAGGASQAAAVFPSLSPATQDLVGPYLVQPFYEGSWWDLRNSGGQKSTALCRPWEVTCSIRTGDWDYVDGVHVRVWYLRSHAATDWPVATNLAAAADTDIWPKFVPTIGRSPRADGDEGGNDKYDVILTDGLDSRKEAMTLSTGLFSCKDTSAFTYLNRSYMLGSLAVAKAILAHELFHGAQFGFDSQSCNYDMKFLSEATATWFEDFVYPTANHELQYTEYYLDRPWLSIDDPAGKPHKPYGGYLFFTYLTRIRGVPPNAIGRVWDQTVSNDEVHALKNGLAAAGASADLDNSWPEFAAYAWNQATPFDVFAKPPDKYTWGAKMFGPNSGSLGTPSATWYLKDTNAVTPLPHLSHQYFYFDFPDATVSSVGFFNGLSRALDLVSVPEFGSVYRSKELPPATRFGGAHVGALLKINGQWTYEDWTDKPFRLFCRDLKAERLEELVVILSNASVESPSTVYPQGRERPLLFASNIGCGEWEAEADVTYRWGQAVVEKMRVPQFTLKGAVDGFYDADTPVFRAFRSISGGYEWSVTGSDQSCTYSGSKSAVISSPMSSFLSMAWVVKGVGYRGITSNMFWEWLTGDPVMRQSCPQPTGTSMIPWNAGEFVLAAIPDQAWARFSPDGKTLTIDPARIPGNQGHVSGVWKFKAKREP